MIAQLLGVAVDEIHQGVGVLDDLGEVELVELEVHAVDERAANANPDLLGGREDALNLSGREVGSSRRKAELQAFEGLALLDQNGRAAPLSFVAARASLHVVPPDGQPVHPEGAVVKGLGRSVDVAHEVNRGVRERLPFVIEDDARHRAGRFLSGQDAGSHEARQENHEDDQPEHGRIAGGVGVKHQMASSGP
ncbi:hypothetical protein D3C87_963160 [compost metagenome]